MISEESRKFIEKQKMKQSLIQTIAGLDKGGQAIEF